MILAISMFVLLLIGTVGFCWYRGLFCFKDHSTGRAANTIIPERSRALSKIKGKTRNSIFIHKDHIAKLHSKMAINGKD
jgi:hypothetical protein